MDKHIGRGAYEWVHTNAKQSAIVPDVRVLEKDNKKSQHNKERK